MSTEPEKKIVIDEDWKSQVEAEREAAQAEKESTQNAETDSNEPAAPSSATPSSTAAEPEDTKSEVHKDEEDIGAHQLPPASFSMFISMLASEAMVGLGQMANPATGKALVNLDSAKYFIDTLNILQEKTQGNLTPDEKAGLETVLSQLQMAFVEIKKQH